MKLPPFYLDWFKTKYPHAKVDEDKGPLVVQLFNVCQGATDAGKLWYEHFYRVLEKLNLTKLIRDLVVFVKMIDRVLVILNINTDDILLCTDSPMVRYKVVQHLV